ncbi:hypothetical protein [Pontibacillus yanchengensis]|nr:hypothetical protein [Pontibacillus yanchengensis]
MFVSMALSRFTDKPNEPVRQLFFDFEAFAHKKGFGRKQSETIEDWFERLDAPYADGALYQKVRYGEETLTENEVKTFKEDLSSLRTALSNKSQ